jgi:predicted metalloprotease with PDZ domain
VTYTFDELVADLNQVMPYEWATFLHDRIDKINPRADLAGIEQGGYKLVYMDKPSASEKMVSADGGRRGGGIDVWYSLGLRVGMDGMIGDVRWNGPADMARIAPGAKIIGVNGQVFSGDLLKAAVHDAKGNTAPIHLILQNDTFLTMADIDYHDGERYPVLQRVEGTAAYLDDITKPLANSPPVPAEEKSE